MTFDTLNQFDGPHVTEDDSPRLHVQLGHVFWTLRNNGWLTVAEIKNAIGRHFKIYHPETSIGARIRDLRKPKFGNHNIEGRYRDGKRIFEFRYMPPPHENVTQGVLL